MTEPMRSQPLGPEEFIGFPSDDIDRLVMQGLRNACRESSLDAETQQWVKAGYGLEERLLQLEAVGSSPEGPQTFSEFFGHRPVRGEEIAALIEKVFRMVHRGSSKIKIKEGLQQLSARHSNILVEGGILDADAVQPVGIYTQPNNGKAEDYVLRGLRLKRALVTDIGGKRNRVVLNTFAYPIFSNINLDDIDISNKTTKRSGQHVLTILPQSEDGRTLERIIAQLDEAVLPKNLESDF